MRHDAFLNEKRSLYAMLRMKEAPWYRRNKECSEKDMSEVFDVGVESVPLYSLVAHLVAIGIYRID